jgi:nucleotide-binding universal stress UspA family protein
MVAVDSPEGAEKPADVALSIAEISDAELVLVHVASPSIGILPPFGAGMPIVVPPSVFTSNREDERKVSRWMTRVAWIAEEKGLKSRARVAPAELAIADQVAAVAEEEGADLIVTGSHDWSRMERLIFGSVSSDVVRKAKCPVLVVH